MSSKSLHLVFDFDGTITQQDTIGALANLGQKFQLERHCAIRPSWAQIVEEYVRDHREYSSDFQPHRDQRTTLEGELGFLRQLRGVELRSLRRVETSGLFRGLDTAALEQGGRDALEDGAVQLRSGFGDIMEAASLNKWRVSVLSVNWSTSFLRGVLGGFQIHDYIANEIQGDGSIAGPGLLGPSSEALPMMTCEDKQKALIALLQRTGSDAAGMVYLGDSTCDIECLTLGRGVAVSTDPASTLMTTLRRVGLQVPPVGDAGPSNDLVWAQTFKEVLDSNFLRR